MTFFFSSYLFNSSNFVSAGRVTFFLCIDLLSNNFKFNKLYIEYNLETKESYKRPIQPLSTRFINSTLRKTSRITNTLSNRFKKAGNKSKNIKRKSKKTTKIRIKNKQINNKPRKIKN
jgi:hypothetical protein